MNDPADTSVIDPNASVVSDQSAPVATPEPVLTPSPTAAPPLDKDPLAVLEELLAKQKAKGAGGAGGGSGGGPGAASASKPVDEDLARRRAEYEQLQVEAAARDQQLLALQEQKMLEIRNMPQYKARVTQNQEKLDDRDEHNQDMAGFQILQLNTKNVFVPQPTDVTAA